MIDISQLSELSEHITLGAPLRSLNDEKIENELLSLLGKLQSKKELNIDEYYFIILSLTKKLIDNDNIYFEATGLSYDEAGDDFYEYHRSVREMLYMANVATHIYDDYCSIKDKSFIIDMKNCASDVKKIYKLASQEFKDMLSNAKRKRR